MSLSSPLEPMLAAPVEHLPRHRGLAYEAKWDGYRCVVFAESERAFVQSRRGSSLGESFPEIADAAEELAVAVGARVVLDGELVVVSEAGRLDFDLLATRARYRSSRRAATAAREHPAHLVCFDLLQIGAEVLTGVPYRQRRARLEDLFARYELSAPWTLCPATTDPDTAAEWMAPEWGAAGIEGVVVKPASGRYRPGARGGPGGWQKCRSRSTHDAVIGAVTGPITMPHTVLLGRWDQGGRLRLVARSTSLPRALRQQIGGVLGTATADHPWREVTFSAGWGTREVLEHRCVRPVVVVEFEGDAARDSGRWRHPVRIRRLRPDLSPDELPGFEGR